MNSLVEELARQLRADYDQAPINRKVASIHLFGISHRDALANVNKHNLAERAGLPRSYGAELGKAIVLGEYVTITKPLA